MFAAIFLATVCILYGWFRTPGTPSTIHCSLECDEQSKAQDDAHGSNWAFTLTESRPTCRIENGQWLPWCQRIPQFEVWIFGIFFEQKRDADIFSRLGTGGSFWYLFMCVNLCPEPKTNMTLVHQTYINDSNWIICDQSHPSSLKTHTSSRCGAPRPLVYHFYPFRITRGNRAFNGEPKARDTQQ